MTSFAHAVNPVRVPQTSDLFVAQPITFETMRVAKAFAHSIDVSLHAVAFEEDLPFAPADLVPARPLERSVLDLGEFKRSRKLPILRDILERLAEASDADYLVYSNVDIAVQPQFYLALEGIIRQGFDGFAVNRRTIEQSGATIADIPILSSMVGEPHPGWDCFVFRRCALQNFSLGNVCLGASGVGRALLWDIAASSTNFCVFKNLHLTYHIGDDRVWSDTEFKDYADHNTREAASGLSRLVGNTGCGTRLDTLDIIGRNPLFRAVLEEASRA